VWLEEDGRIVAIELVRGFLVGLALPALVVGYDAPNVTGSYRAGFSTLQHRLHVGGNSVHHPIAMIPVATSQLRTDDRPGPNLGAGEHLAVEGDTAAIAAASEDYGSRVVAADAIAPPL